MGEAPQRRLTLEIVRPITLKALHQRGIRSIKPEAQPAFLHERHVGGEKSRRQRRNTHRVRFR